MKFAKIPTAVMLALLILASVVYTPGGNRVSAQSTPAPTHTSCTTGATPAATLGMVTQTVNVGTAGTYRLWSRIKAPNTAANSFYLQDDNCAPISVGDAASIPANTWTWVNYKDGSTSALINVSLAAGSHTFKYVGKEANVLLDRVLLLSDTSCVPQGTGDNCANADSIKPTVSLTAPANGSSVTKGTSVNITADATDNVGVTKIEFLVDGIVVGTDTTSPFSYAWNTTSATTGNHALTARAYDATNNITTSSPVTVSVAGTTTGTSTPYKGSAASLPGKIEMENFDEGGSNVAYSDSDAGNTLDSGYRDTDVDLRNRPSESNGWTVSSTIAGEWLKYSINVAQSGQYKVVVRGAANGSTGGTIRMDLDGQALASSTLQVPGTGSWSTFEVSPPTTVTLPAGQHILKVYMATAGKTTPSPQAGSLDYLEFTLAGTTTPADTVKPTVSLTAPANGSSTAIGSKVTIAANASDNTGVAKVEFYRSTTLLGSDTSSPYSYSWDTAGVAAGNHTLTARAYDAAGNVATSASVSISLQTTNSAMPGDANGDSRVNGIDYSILASNDGKNYPPADFNKDGTVGAADLAILLSRWTW